MYTDDQLLPLSALQHWQFCPRQCALIHLEQQWSENRLTAEGRLLHEQVHEADTENRPGIRIVRGLRLVSLDLGVIGQTDVVEFHQSETGMTLPGASGLWQPFPVEYKRGKPKPDNCDKIQLCAQAMCLEEMLTVAIEQGALFYGQPRRRQEVCFDAALRQETRHIACQLHELIDTGVTPKAAYTKKCDNCSLVKICMPKITGITKDIARYLANAKKFSEGSDS